MKIMSVANRLAGNQYQIDEEENHIRVNQGLAKSSGEGKLLIRVCPAHVYSENPDGSIGVQYEACLECGTCLAVTSPGVVSWHYPRGGFGVEFREG
jgi:ferredoxin like protein